MHARTIVQYHKQRFAEVRLEISDHKSRMSKRQRETRSAGSRESGRNEIGVDGGDPCTSSKSTRRYCAAQDEIVTAVANLGFLQLFITFDDN
ncbi:hypothetical protein Y032_0006g2929 [Ancylostoma ceylanicum]|uniref:Uncharacterized protein n=1 Tax=Ancylostoma ceylanicum TaxID=53326 RepID=A0A016VP27_9BILA|nr:hypothetical protein Y032_0006g2929 [Ancylostoma ceylanicum]